MPSAAAARRCGQLRSKQFVEPRERAPSPLGIAGKKSMPRIESWPRTVRHAATLLRRIHRTWRTRRTRTLRADGNRHAREHADSATSL